MMHGSKNIYKHLKSYNNNNNNNNNKSSNKSPWKTRTALIFFIALLLIIIGALFTARCWINDDALMISTATSSTAITTTSQIRIMHSTPSQTSQPHKQEPVPLPAPPPPSSLPPPPRQQAAYPPFKCAARNKSALYKCGPSPSSLFPQTGKSLPSSSSCPEYFRWIHEDLSPWKTTGITRKMVERAQRTANFRLIILKGRAYVEIYRRSFQTRDVFTLWGILQLLRRYPGRIPDLDLMFDCVDLPVVSAAYHRGRNMPAPPPLFRYCGNDSTLDIVFPDWSFWGWPEINIKPWEALQREIEQGNKKIKWIDREPYAYWKGNPAVALTRKELLKCNVSEGQDWNARIYTQDWLSETQRGFKHSDLASQCKHRYKIYIEGTAWSVSEKYILACNSPALIVKPIYYDFFTRGLMPVHHYWPIRDEDKCKSIKFAVDWGNSHKQKSQAIGKEGSKFIKENLKMDYIYDYMFHLLNEYAKLLKYKPTKPQKAIELCAESMACPAKGIERKFMMESMVKSPSSSPPCSLPPQYSPGELRMLNRRKTNVIKQVEMWEQSAWESKSR